MERDEPTTLRARDLAVALDGIEVLTGIDLDVVGGCCVGVLGESGAGKTVLVDVLSGRVRPRAGRVTLGGAPLPPGGSSAVQLVPQDPSLGADATTTVRTLLAVALRERRGLGDDALEAATVALLDAVGIGPTALDRATAACSRGECQRIAIARALVGDPAVLLLDDPLAALDPVAANGVIERLAALRADGGLGCLVTSPDVASIRRMADEVLVLRDGVVVERGPVAQVLDGPRDPYTRALVEAGRPRRIRRAPWPGPGPSAPP